jgi:tRNA (guanosine-2'-O-)-methyltransferase
MSLFLHNDVLTLEDGSAYTAEAIHAILGPLITPERAQRIAEVVADRTCAIVPVMEGLYDHGNISAVLRSAEALGFQVVHIIELLELFKQANRVTQGAHKWVDIVRWQSSEACVESLRAQGYRIAAMCMEEARPIDELDFTIPTALFFGNEKEGLTPYLLDTADERVVVPMSGFTRSFNISVAAALSLYHIRQDRVRRLGRHGDLSQEQQHILRALYTLRTLPSAPTILRCQATPAS